MMTYSLNKQASLLLCDAMLCRGSRLEDGDAIVKDWTDSNDKFLPANRFWNNGCDVTIAAGLCMGIKLKCAKVDSLIIYVICITQINTIILICAKV